MLFLGPLTAVLVLRDPRAAEDASVAQAHLKRHTTYDYSKNGFISNVLRLYSYRGHRAIPNNIELYPEKRKPYNGRPRLHLSAFSHTLLGKHLLSNSPWFKNLNFMSLGTICIGITSAGWASSVNHRYIISKFSNAWDNNAIQCEIEQDSEQ